MKRFLALLFLSAILSSAARAHKAATAAPSARKLCEVQDARLNESSGLAASRRYAAQNLLWTHNDSGGEPRAFCLNLKGEVVAEVLFQNARNIDWEDMACEGNFLYAGDIGDNFHRRENIQIYRIQEPQFDPNKTAQVLSAPCETETLKYPDGAHDAETLLVTRDGEVLIATKDGVESKIFRAPKKFQNGSTQTLQQIGAYAFRGKNAKSYLATGGSVAPDEKHLVIRTYTHAYQWEISAGFDWKKTFQNAPRSFKLPPSKQGESICYSADGTKFYATSEGAPCPLFEIENETPK